MSDWTHPICDDCWDKQNPDRPSPRAGTGDCEVCCWCGGATGSGIYLRADPQGPQHHDGDRPDHP